MGLGVEGESGGEAASFQVDDEGICDMEIDGGISDSIRRRRHEMVGMSRCRTKVKNARYQPWCIFPASFRLASECYRS